MRRAPLRVLAVILGLAFGSLTAAAVQPDEVLSDAKMEARARALSSNLRCLVCQNQSIDDSNAPLARDLRLLVRERLKTGDSDQAVMDYVVARYGEFVLLKPPLKLSTLLLWLSPLLFLLTGAWVVLKSIRTPPQGSQGTAPLTEAERTKLGDILK